jgi:hypothetical protein
MKRVFEHINNASRKFEQKQLFQYLRNDTSPPEHRMKFVPCMAHFVMTFADLYHFFLTEPTPKDQFDHYVNTHLSEEGAHWKWYLSDLTNMGLDPSLRFTDALRFLWGDSTLKTRKLAYEICRLSAGMSSLHKLVLVMAIEATGRVGLEAAVPVGDKVATSLDRKKLVYFGMHHLDTERQHTLEGDSAHRSLEQLVLTEPQRLELCAIVDKVFEHFEGFVDDAFTFAMEGDLRAPKLELHATA